MAYERIHWHYDQLTDAEREALNSAFHLLTNRLKVDRILFDGGDQIERAVDAVALAIINARV